MEDDSSNTRPPSLSPDELIDLTQTSTAIEAGFRPVAEPNVVQELSAPMFDVHTPHETARTWKDFFIHIAIITIGLLIAIGLEQTVEYFHHRHQAAEMAKNLIQESIENRDVAQFDLARFDEIDRVLQINMAKLFAIRASASRQPFVPTPLPANVTYALGDTAWVTMRDSALLPIVPMLLVKNYWKLEFTNQRLSLYTSASSESRVRLNSLLNLHGETDVLTLKEIDDLLLAYSDYRAHLTRTRSLLTEYETMDNLAIDNKVITINSNQAQEADRGIQQALPTEH